MVNNDDHFIEPTLNEKAYLALVDEAMFSRQSICFFIPAVDLNWPLIWVLDIAQTQNSRNANAGKEELKPLHVRCSEICSRFSKLEEVHWVRCLFSCRMRGYKATNTLLPSFNFVPRSLVGTRLCLGGSKRDKTGAPTSKRHNSLCFKTKSNIKIQKR